MFNLQIGICVWPILQTVNFLFIPEKNRVVYVSICSLMWTSFLAYMKSLQDKKLVGHIHGEPVVEIQNLDTKEEKPKSDKTTWWTSALH